MDYKRKYYKYKNKYLQLKGGINNIPNIKVSQLNKKDTFDNLINILEQMDFFRKNQYNIPLPKHELFIELSNNPDKIKDNPYIPPIVITGFISKRNPTLKLSPENV